MAVATASSNTENNLSEQVNASLSLKSNLAPPSPAFIEHRINLWNKIKARQDALLAQKPQIPIKVTLLDGRQIDAISNKTTPLEIAAFLGKSLAERAIVAKVNGKLHDLTIPLVVDSVLEILDWDSPEARQVFWHSTAHILGEACEKHYGCLLCVGPPVEEGFYYEMRMKDGLHNVTPDEFPVLEASMKAITKEKQLFERLEMAKEELLEMFAYSPYKSHLIREKVPDGSTSTVYRCGSLIDPCLGPHVPDTGRIKSLALLRNSSSNFLGNVENDALQRIYGISFPEEKLLKEYKKFLEEAAKRDHRKIGKDQSLFFFHELSPGSCFWLPHGTRIYNTLLELMRKEYRKRGFTEVITPNIYNVNLWKTSGHWENYRENMYGFEIEKEAFALKPMNCPGHCLMFAHKERSYRELPIRFADFGVLHRNEVSGSLSGLTRVRRFQQDDAHIFCTNEQITSEITSCLEFLKHIYGIFGFEFTMKLSTRPEKYLGELEVWNAAESQLEAALNASGCSWELNPGDGAFYGPKIDITIQDAHRRRHQCGTIQLDFQLPIRFKLEFRDSGEQDAMKRPVIIHRAILGSVERMTAILIENFGEEWPFWLSPRQVMIVPVSHASDDYSKKVHVKMHDFGLFVDVDLSDLTLNKKVRNAEVSRYNFVVVLGKQEEEARTVNIRRAGPEGKDLIVPLEEALELFGALKQSMSRENKLQVSESKN